MRVAIVLGSLASVPPVRLKAAATVIYKTVENLPLKDIKVFSYWESGLEKVEYDHTKFEPIKPFKTINFLIDLLYALPYRIYKPIISRWVRPIGKEFVKYALTVPFKVRRYNPTVIVNHSNYSLVYLLRQACPQAKLIYYHHGSNMHLRLSEVEWKKFTKVVDGIISVSKTAFDKIREHYGPIEVSTWVIHNGVDLTLFNSNVKKLRDEVRRRWGLESDAFVFLYAGRLVRAKGIHFLLDAFSQVLKINPRARLLIAGSSAQEPNPEPLYAQALLEKAKELGNAVKFVGGFPNDQMPQVYAAADVTILPSLASEGIPLSLLESMACGVPVIATDIGGIPEIVFHRRNGLLISKERVAEELPYAMQELMEDRALWRDCAEAAADYVARNHTYQIVAQKFMAVLEQVTSRSRGV